MRARCCIPPAPPGVERRLRSGRGEYLRELVLKMRRPGGMKIPPVTTAPEEKAQVETEVECLAIAMKLRTGIVPKRRREV